MKTYFLFSILILLTLSNGCRDKAVTEPVEEDQTIVPTIISGEFVTPAEGDTWQRGSTYRIEWRDFSPDYNVDLILLKRNTITLLKYCLIHPTWGLIRGKFRMTCPGQLIIN